MGQAGFVVGGVKDETKRGLNTMARKKIGTKVFVAEDILAKIIKRRESEGRRDSMVAYVQWVLNQYVDGHLVPVEVHGVRAIRVRKINREDEHRKAG
jgi:hypothetical protein